ncbi:MAG: glutathione S-transferase N-terminal domain-containing protein [Stenotrophobium sp.]
MKMKLYCSSTSPFARKVRVVADELGLGDLIEEVMTDPFNPAPEFLAANPLSKIPTLVTEKGEALPDSKLIVEYLQTRSHSLVSLPRGSRRWATLRRGQVAEGIMDAAVATQLEKRRPESIIYPSFLDRQREIILRSLDVLTLELDALSLNMPGIVEITTAVGLAYLDFRLPYLEWRKQHEALSAWQNEFAQRPSMVKTQPPPA